MISYTGIFDILNHRGLKKSDLRKILSSKTVAKLSKGEPIGSEVIEKICLFLECQPSDIMMILENTTIESSDGKIHNAVVWHEIDYNTPSYQSIDHYGIKNEETYRIDWIN